MSDVQLAWLSTAAWFILTSALFVALAGWSAGNGSWTILPGFVRGVRSWVSVEPPAELPARSGPAAAAKTDALPVAEVVEL